jgi:hypothetical protein
MARSSRSVVPLQESVPTTGDRRPPFGLAASMNAVLLSEPWSRTTPDRPCWIADSLHLARARLTLRRTECPDTRRHATQEGFPITMLEKGKQ